MENELSVINLQIASKVVTIRRTGKRCLLLHISGTQVTTGLIGNWDIWPRSEMSDEQISVVADKSITDAEIRIGYWTELDNEFKPVMKTGKPKWLTLFAGEEEIIPDGEPI